MHRTKVRIVEDALDANNTIAAANRADFDRAGVKVVNFMSAPGAGQDDAARARRGRLRDTRVGVLEGDVQGSMDADRLASLHVPVTQLNTDPSFGGECHLDANMVRSAIPALPLAGDRPADHRERRQPGVPRGVQDRGGRASDGVLGHRGRGQAAQVPADVPHLRARADQQDRPAAPPRLRSRPAPLQHRPGPSRRRADRWSAHAPARASTRGASGWSGVAAREEALA